MNGCLPRNCKICTYYKAEEIGDSDFGAIYADECTCSKDKDIDEQTEEFIKAFDYNSVKECCIPDFWIVADMDKEIEKLFNDEMSESDDAEPIRSSKRFHEKYILS